MTSRSPISSKTISQFGDNRAIHYNRYDASDCSGSWHQKAEVLPRKPGRATAYPSVDVDKVGRPYVTYSRAMGAKDRKSCSQNSCPSGYHCYRSGICIRDFRQFFTRRKKGAWQSGKWQEPTMLNPGTKRDLAHHGSIFVRNGSSVHAIWLGQTWHNQTIQGQTVFYAQHDGSNWTAPQPTPLGAHAADIAADGSHVHAFSSRARYTRRTISPSGASWSRATGVSNGTALVNLMQMDIDNRGRLHAVWNQDYRIWYASTDASGQWRKAKPVSPPKMKGKLYSNEPGIEAGPGGTVHIVWSQSQCGFQEPGGGAECEFGAIYYLRTHYDQLQ